MTRINLIPPKLLTDQHLLAEKKEINQLAGQMLKSLRSPNFFYANLPERFTLGKGHVLYFAKYGAFISKRFDQVNEEMKRRFKKDYPNNFNNIWIDYPHLYNDWEPLKKDFEIIIKRIKEKILLKPNWYKYNQSPLNMIVYFNQLDQFLDQIPK